MYKIQIEDSDIEVCVTEEHPILSVQSNNEPLTIVLSQIKAGLKETDYNEVKTLSVGDFTVFPNNVYKKITAIAPTEYSGKVVLLDDEKMRNEDSIMNYIEYNKTKYVILPNEQCNLGRFISGINNFKKSSNKKNLESIQFRIGWNVHVVLYAKREIYKGETLYYDYNNKKDCYDYDTSNFV
jgi:hypothetical protein